METLVLHAVSPIPPDIVHVFLPITPGHFQHDHGKAWAIYRVIYRAQYFQQDFNQAFTHFGQKWVWHLSVCGAA